MRMYLQEYVIGGSCRKIPLNPLKDVLFPVKLSRMVSEGCTWLANTYDAVMHLYLKTCAA